MAKFVGVTDYNDEKVLINIDMILWYSTYNKEKDDTIIYMAAPGKNDYPVYVVAKESKETIMRYINNDE